MQLTNGRAFKHVGATVHLANSCPENAAPHYDEFVIHYFAGAV
jgi:hypothetical protein